MCTSFHFVLRHRFLLFYTTNRISGGAIVANWLLVETESSLNGRRPTDSIVILRIQTCGYADCPLTFHSNRPNIHTSSYKNTTINSWIKFSAFLSEEPTIRMRDGSDSKNRIYKRTHAFSHRYTQFSVEWLKFLRCSCMIKFFHNSNWHVEDLPRFFIFFTCFSTSLLPIYLYSYFS